MKTPKAFTLIELLVVISIIALLIALLLPALGAARETARSVQCLTNNKMMGIATGSYHTDNGGAFPIGSATHHTWAGNPGPPFDLNDYWDIHIAKQMGLSFDVTVDAERDANYTPMFTCPSDWRSGVVTNANHLLRLRSYSANAISSSLRPNDGLLWSQAHGITPAYNMARPPRIEDLAAPTATAWLHEYPVFTAAQTNIQYSTMAGHFAGWLGFGSLPTMMSVSGGQIGRQDFYHGGGLVASVLFADGHSGMHEPREAYERSGKNWWRR